MPAVLQFLLLCAVVFTMRRISVSAYITPCEVFFTVRRISVSAHITLCAVVFTVRRRLHQYQPISHSVLWFSLSDVGYISISLYHTLCCGFHCQTQATLVSVYITLCAVVFTVRRRLHQYQPISHSVLWFSLSDIGYISISLYHTLCCGFHCQTWATLVSAYITLCAVVFTVRRGLHQYQPISHSVLWFSLSDVGYISISLYHTLCCGFHCQTQATLVSALITLCAVVFTVRRRLHQYQPISHSVLWFSLSDVGDISISPYHTLCCGFHCQTQATLVSAYITLCAVVFTVRRRRHQYQPISHSVLWFSLSDIGYISISLYHTLCCGFHCQTWATLVSAYITLCAVVFTVRRRRHQYQPISHSVLWFSLSDVGDISISLYHTLCCGFHCQTQATLVSAYITLCAVVFTVRRRLHQYQPISHSVLWFSLSDVGYISISPYHTLCCGFHCQTQATLVSAYITLCAVVFTVRRRRHQYQPISHSVLWFSLSDVGYISISLYNTLCCGFHCQTQATLVSAYITLCAVVFTVRRRLHQYQPISHSVLWFSLSDVGYISISLYHTLCCGFHCQTQATLVSAYITLCAVVFTVRRRRHQYQPISHSVLWFSLSDVGYISISLYHTLCCGFHCQTQATLVSAYITLCAVVFTVRHRLHQYQPISHSVLWFSLSDVGYISISLYHTLCCGFHCQTWATLVSAYITLCAVVFTVRRGLHQYQPISHSVLWFSLSDVGDISISPYHTLCCGFHCQTQATLVSAYITLCAVVFTVRRRRHQYQPLSHSVLWFSLSDVGYISISLYHTLCCGFHCQTQATLVSAHITLCAVVFTVRHRLHQYQPISHSVLWFSLSDVGYISISLYHTLCCGFHCQTQATLVSAHITLCAVVFTVRRRRHQYQPISHSVLWFSLSDIGDISISLYHTLCCGFHCQTQATLVSAYITLCAVVFTVRRGLHQYQPLSHSVLWFSLSDIGYISISLYHTLCCGFHCQTWATLVSAYITLCAVVFTVRRGLHQYQPISHSVLWFSLSDIGYISISLYHTLCCGFHCQTWATLVSAYITLCAVVFTVRRRRHQYQPISHSVLWFSLSDIGYISISLYHTLCCGFHCQTWATLVSAYITLCAVVFTVRRRLHQYQPISHSVLWFSLSDVGYISISLYHTLCCGFHCQTQATLVSAYITLCAVVFTVRRGLHQYQPISHSVLWFSLSDVGYISISLYHTLCCGFHCQTQATLVSAYITLCAVVFTVRRRRHQYQPISHSVLWFSLSDVGDISISLYHTLCCGVHCQTQATLVSAYITLCAVVFTVRRGLHQYQPISHSVLWFSLSDVGDISISLYHTLCCGFHCQTWATLVSAYITLCAVVFTVRRRLHQYQPISHSVLWFSLSDVGYISISLYHTLCCGFHCQTQATLVSAYITLCAVVFTVRRRRHQYQPISHSVLQFSLSDVGYISISLYHTLCCGFHCQTQATLVSAYITLCAVVFTVRRRLHQYQPISHSVLWFSLSDVGYISISQYHTLCCGFHNACYETYIDISLYSTLCGDFRSFQVVRPISQKMFWPFKKYLLTFFSSDK